MEDSTIYATRSRLEIAPLEIERFRCAPAILNLARLTAC
jgi:hypothetical protein